MSEGGVFHPFNVATTEPNGTILMIIYHPKEPFIFALDDSAAAVLAGDLIRILKKKTGGVPC